MNISSIESIDSPKQREFDLSVRNAHRVHVTDKDGTKHIALHVDKQTTYTFRCKTEEIRDEWVKQLHKSLQVSVNNVLLELYETDEE